MSSEEQQRLFENTARNLEFIKIRHIVNCFKADPHYGEGVAKAAGIPMSKIEAAVSKSK